MNYNHVRSFFDYNETTGHLLWKTRMSNRVNYGDVAGFINPDGYVEIRVDNKLYYAHRLVWLWYYGYDSEYDIDHIDRNKHNNKISNLRETTQQCNTINTGNFSHNTSGVKGVSWDNKKGIWFAQMKVNQKTRGLGLYNEFDDAVCARLAGEQCLGWGRCDCLSPAHQYVIKEIQHGSI